MAIIYQVEGIWGKRWGEAMLYWEKSIQREHSLCNNPESGACGLIHRVPSWKPVWLKHNEGEEEY